MITGKVITGLVVVLLLIQFLPLPQTVDVVCDDSHNAYVNLVVDDDTGDFNNSLPAESIILYQQTIATNSFFAETKLLPGFPACIYSNYFADIFVPPPDKAVC